MTTAAPQRSPAAGWTRPEEVKEQLRTKWQRGTYLRSRAEGVPWEPVRVRLKGPSAKDLLENTTETLAWIEGMRSWSVGGRGGPRCRIEDRVVRNRSLGHNEVPAYVVLDTIEMLAALVDRRGDVAKVDQILALTSERRPDLVPWVIAHPMAVLDVADDWVRILDVVDWVDRHDTSQFYLRHLDLSGVDTKFVERHRKLLGQLLQAVLPAERLDPAASRFDARLGFRSVPSYVRFRVLAPLDELPESLSELSVRAAELARLELSVRTVFVVENQATYLAFPDVPSSIVVFGEGFKASMLEAVPWLADRELVYWGDIDTHGFRILDQLRSRVPGVRSLLMDEPTLTAHLDHAGSEESPTAVPLAHLTPEEHRLYCDLVEDRFGRSIRLEQERIRFGAVRRALEPWTAQ